MWRLTFVVLPVILIESLPMGKDSTCFITLRESLLLRLFQFSL